MCKPFLDSFAPKGPSEAGQVYSLPRSWHSLWRLHFHSNHHDCDRMYELRLSVTKWKLVRDYSLHIEELNRVLVAFVRLAYKWNRFEFCTSYCLGGEWNSCNYLGRNESDVSHLWATSSLMDFLIISCAITSTDAVLPMYGKLSRMWFLSSKILIKQMKISAYFNLAASNYLFSLVIDFYVTYFPLSLSLQMLEAREKRLWSAFGESNRAFCKNFEYTSINCRLMSGKPSLHICCRRWCAFFISFVVCFGVG